MGHINDLCCTQISGYDWQVASYGDLQLLAQLVNTRSHLSINIMNVHTQAN